MTSTTIPTGAPAQADMRVTRLLTVRSRRMIADGVVELVLGDPAGAALPPWEPGAHVELVLGDRLRRSYSLCGSPHEREVWRLAILREPAGRGGSSRVHDALVAGVHVAVAGPRNHFDLVTAGAYHFVAGGIGITPILPMIEAADRAGARWRLTYGGRTRASMAYVDELHDRYGPDRVELVYQDRSGLIDVAGIVDGLAPDALLYCCGPGALLDAVTAACAGPRSSVLHLERFTAAPQHDDELDAFEVEIASTGEVYRVGAGESVLNVLDAAGVDVLMSCSEGICGTCETGVLAGRIRHRDSFLDEGERARGDRMMICVSRAAAGQRLVLDL